MRDEQMMDAPAIKGTDIFDTTMTESNVRGVPALIVQLYQTVRALNKLFPDRPFTPDGHLVGSIGEVIAADTYDLTTRKVLQRRI